ncbi:MAG: 3-phosphoserine/phosphohydroxythreonine transaminase [Neisseriaceae bacterium]|nr:3-phosphoserine/phosphohydroxythreonine transaminase [Neisseriaceae bacterium]
MNPFFRVHNFSAGPAALPLSVLQSMQAEMLNFQGSGMSLIEMSHRGEIFTQVLHRTRDSLRRLLQVPENYHILFAQGGATGQNAMIPLNLLGGHKNKSEHIISGIWSQKTQLEAAKYGLSRLVANNQNENGIRTAFPDLNFWEIEDGTAYVAFCTNETINGIQYTPDSTLVEKVQQSGAFLVADMSSDILSKPINVSDYGVIYGGAQKNIGMSGLTFIIVRDDLLDQAQAICPSAFLWKNMDNNDSMFNTPTTMAIYCAGLVFEWLESEHKTLANIEKINVIKANKLYQAIDNSSLFFNNIDPVSRSRMNVPFFFKSGFEHLQAEFLAGAAAHHLIGLKGHNIIGGLRASLYNAVSLKSVEVLIDYLHHFENQYGGA